MVISETRTWVPEFQSFLIRRVWVSLLVSMNPQAHEQHNDGSWDNLTASVWVYLIVTAVAI